ncbi:pentatricopeptide repeat-containing protein chloroplastic-like [Dorcoceras hygrometricum]|uniref:Pentatricopeptide repeat-containing protein chloroplastic-like n=1 Tax=Dorcoceras hygrometricum TaxID=472368 RepID=A0A2Z7BTX3_9LAMI|nr:pentatricopeptide repeat-containing protein chloroplastic-like [Dorcoceras hygrometricum]
MLVSVNSIQPWNSTFPVLDFASRCRTEVEIKQLHASLIVTGNIYNQSLVSRIVLGSAFSQHKPVVNFARDLFFEKKYKDSFIWNAIIKSFSHGDEPEYAFNVFALMLVNGVLVDEYSFSLVLKSCARLGLSDKGMQLHGLMSKFGFRSDVLLQNCLICMYVKCGCIHFGKKVFDEMLIRDSFTYNLIIDGYVKNGMVTLARELFDLMPMEMKNLVTWNTMISGHGKLEDGFEFAWELFMKMPAKDLVSWNLMIDCCAKNGRMETAGTLFQGMPKRDEVTWASMVDGYARIGKIEDARNIFDAMPQRDVVSCNAMMAGYVNNGRCMDAMKVFHDMFSASGCDLAPDSVTLLTALSATTQLGDVDEGIEIHRYMEEHGFAMSGRLGVALIDMYAKCGRIEQALDIFEGVIQEKDVDHWNAIIGGLAIHGMGGLAFDVFIEMERLSIKPDDITFITVLNACGHSGMVKEGIICFEVMRKLHNLVPNLQHYGCLVDILSRAGHVEEAVRIVKHMPIEPNDVIWRTLLSACNNQEILELGVSIAKHLVGIDSYNSSSYILLSNAYAQSGLWDCVRSVRNMMKERNINQIPGRSWIEFDGTVHEFFAGSTNINGVKEICSSFGGLQKVLSAGDEILVLK